MKFDEILFGTAYYDEYMPYDRIDTDFQMMKKAGMNVIRIAESTWSTWEKSDNEFDFSSLHKMLSKAEEYDLKVIVGTPTYAIPAWLAKKHPDIMAVSKNGQAIYGHRQIFDQSNEHYRFHAERIIRKLMEEVKDSPVVIGYQIDNETTSADSASETDQLLFVEWLKKKYPDINEFNAEFGLDYWSNRIDNWNDMPDIRGTINGSLSAAYKEFLRATISDFMHWQADIIHEYAKPDQFITHNFDYFWPGYSFGIQPKVNQFESAKYVDIAGVDIYHPTQDKLTGAEITFGGAVGRTLKKGNYLVLETQAQGRAEWLAYPGQLRLQAYSHLSCCSNSVMYWHWHSIHNSFESYWKGILSHNLSENASYNELSVFGNELKGIQSHLINMRKQNKLAIIIDNSSLCGLEEFPISDSLTYNHILRSFFDAAYELNIEADLISVNDNFEDYPFLIIPALYSASNDTIHKIRNYISNGGHALMSYKSVFSDSEIKIYSDNQPHGLTDVFGFTYDQFTIPENVSLDWVSSSANTIVSGNTEELYTNNNNNFNEVKNNSINDNSDKNNAFCSVSTSDVSEWMELLIPDSCEVWATYKHKYWSRYAAITNNNFGKGSATYIGCNTTKNSLKSLYKRWMLSYGYEFSNYEFPCIIKRGLNSLNEEIIYIFNYSSDDITITSNEPDAINLLDNSIIKNGSLVKIDAWGLIILCIKKA